MRLHKPNLCNSKRGRFLETDKFFSDPFKTSRLYHKQSPQISTPHRKSTKNRREKLKEIVGDQSKLEIMKLVWTPDTALKAYVCTVKTCGNSKDSSVAEFLSAMAAGWNAKLIVESWSKGGPIATSIGLAVAAKHTCGRHVCAVPDDGSRSEYVKAMHDAGMRETEVLVGEAEEVMAGLVGVDFLVADCRRRDFVRILRFAKLSNKGAVLACKNAFQQFVSGFKWHGVLERGTRVVKTVYLPVGQGLDMAHIGSHGGSCESSKGGPSRWIKHVDQHSGEEHLYRDKK